jgi:tRNA pseudouridine32 synthase/23S rRNA pseudouridine746 synthase
MPVPCNCFIPFRKKTNDIPPDRLNNPFYYEPHPLAIQATKQLQDEILTMDHVQHNFGFDEGGLGKMFGVLVVAAKDYGIGFLVAFSGKLDSGAVIDPFVPPVYNIRDDDSFFLSGERTLNEINQQITQLENDKEYLQALYNQLLINKEEERERNSIKEKISASKLERMEKRKQNADPVFQREMDEMSRKEQLYFKERKKYWKLQREKAQEKIDIWLQKIGNLQHSRKVLSASLQQQIFEHFTFLNAFGEKRNLYELFSGQPPSGAGECTAPRLLHYAYKQGYKPLCIAEFWWGKPPLNELRRHGQFYPACKSRCEPILKHMLIGLEVDQNQLLEIPAAKPLLKVVYEDEFLIAFDKPAGLLSVPGNVPLDSVYLLLKEQYPEKEWFMIHRLDMATSGILLVAKQLSTYKTMQRLFAQRQVKKRYTALLDGMITLQKGEITLPLRLDPPDRPRQVVCHLSGKPARTIYQSYLHDNGRTRVHFYPVSGRTHQLRVHAAHPEGLDCPIVGDDLYGNKGERLLLHADRLSFAHPVSGCNVEIRSDSPF